MGLCPTMEPSTPFVHRPSFACRINQLPARKNWPCAPDELKRPGHDERARAASKERPGIAKAQREGESPGEHCPGAVRDERALKRWMKQDHCANLEVPISPSIVRRLSSVTVRARNASSRACSAVMKRSPSAMAAARIRAWIAVMASTCSSVSGIASFSSSRWMGLGMPSSSVALARPHQEITAQRQHGIIRG